MPIGFNPQKRFDINNNKKDDFHSKKSQKPKADTETTSNPLKKEKATELSKSRQGNLLHNNERKVAVLTSQQLCKRLETLQGPKLESDEINIIKEKIFNNITKMRNNLANLNTMTERLTTALTKLNNLKSTGSAQDINEAELDIKASGSNLQEQLENVIDDLSNLEPPPTIIKPLKERLNWVTANIDKIEYKSKIDESREDIRSLKNDKASIFGMVGSIFFDSTSNVQVELNQLETAYMQAETDSQANINLEPLSIKGWNEISKMDDSTYLNHYLQRRSLDKLRPIDNMMMATIDIKDLDALELNQLCELHLKKVDLLQFIERCLNSKEIDKKETIAATLQKNLTTEEDLTDIDEFLTKCAKKILQEIIKESRDPFESIDLEKTRIRLTQLENNQTEINKTETTLNKQFLKEFNQKKHFSKQNKPP